MRPWAELVLLAFLAGVGCESSGSLLGNDDDSSLRDDDDATSDDDDGASDDDDATGDVPPLVINEISANNGGAVLDDMGLPSDWLEIYNPTDASVYLGGWFVSDDWTEPDRHTLPAGLVVPASGFLVLWADGDDDPEDAHLPFRLSAEGEAVGIFAPDGETVDWVEFPAAEEDEAWARLPDGADAWAAVDVGTPGVSNVALQEGQVELVPTGATWRFLDTGIDPGADWTTVSFDDSSWGAGPGPLGYGDPVATEVSFGGDPAAKHITTWFRHAFKVPQEIAEGLIGLELSLRVDDGAVVHLNGSEMTRVRMPSGPITPTTVANQTVGGGGETAYGVYLLTAGSLVAGINQLAVEVHQAGAGSSDIVMDLHLDANVITDITP